MIVLFNGAPKHASFFPLFIAMQACAQINKTVVQEYSKKAINMHWLQSIKRDFLRQTKHTDTLFFIKGHFNSASERDALIDVPTMKIVLIWRDIRDVLVSQYFFDINKFSVNHGTFDKYYWKRAGGRTNLLYQLAYRRVWDKVYAKQNIHYVDFFALKNDFVQEANKLLSFLDIFGVDMQDLKQRTSIESVRKLSGDPQGNHFRKGTIGDYSNHIHSPAVLADIDMLTNLSDAGLLEKIRYEIEMCRQSSHCKDILAGHLFRAAKAFYFRLNNLR